MSRRGFQLVPWPLAVLVCICAVAGADELVRAPGGDHNAALLYWQAFGQLSELPQAERLVLDTYWETDKYWLERKVAVAVKHEVFRKTAGAARTIHFAVRMSRCDWEEGPSRGVEPKLPRVGMCRSLGRFLAFRARCQIEQGQPHAAVEDLLAGFTLARHAAADKNVLGLLVGVSVEGVSEGAVVDELQQMDAPALDALQSGLDHIPPWPTWKAILAQDKRVLDEWLIPQFAATGDPDAWKAVLRRMYPEDPYAGLERKAANSKASPKPPKVKRGVSGFGPLAGDLIARFGTREALVRSLDEAHKVLDELAQFSFPPPGKNGEVAMAKLDEMAKRSPLFRDYCSLQGMTYYATVRAAVQFQLLRAAIAVQRHGPEALKDFPDPGGDGPFEYRKRPDGFELVSQFRHPGSGYERFSIKVGPLARGEVRFR